MTKMPVARPTWYDLELNDGPGSPAHHAGVVAGVAVGRPGNVKSRLGSVDQQVSPHTGMEEKVGEP